MRAGAQQLIKRASGRVIGRAQHALRQGLCRPIQLSLPSLLGLFHLLRLPLGHVLRPLLLHHARQPVDQQVQKATHTQAQQGGPQQQRGFGHQTICPIWKTGRYSASTRPPTSKPMTTMVAGSISRVSCSSRSDSSLS